MHDLDGVKMEFEESISTLRDDIYRQSLDGVYDNGWITLYGSADQQFDLETVKHLSDHARAVFLKNPLVNRAVRLKSLTIFGQSFTIDYEDEEEYVKEFIDKLLAEEFFSDYENLFQIESELQVTGNLFLRIERADEEFPYSISMIPVDEISDYVFHPDDNSRLILIKREWVRTEMDYTTGKKISAPVKMWHPVDPPKHLSLIHI